MLRTGRFDLTPVPQRLDYPDSDELPGRGVTVVPQENGTVVVCQDAASYATGARFKVVVGQPLIFEDVASREQIWLASPDNVSVDVVEMGVGV